MTLHVLEGVDWRLPDRLGVAPHGSGASSGKGELFGNGTLRWATNMEHRSRLLRRAPALVMALGILAAGAAFAHSEQEATFPVDGAVLSVAPDVVSMTFDTPIRVTMIRLTGATGGTFELERSDGMEPVTEFRATPPPLPAGVYIVEWRGLSADGHPVKGRFSFEIAR